MKPSRRVTSRAVGRIGGVIPAIHSGTAAPRPPLMRMSLFKTLLGSIIVCGVLLVLAALTLGSGLSGVTAQPHGLTAASVLASDGMGPDGRPDEASDTPRRSDHVAVAPTAETQPES